MATVRRSLSEIRKRGGGQVDWARVDATTEEDIQKMIESDPDTAPNMGVGRDWRRVITPQSPNVGLLRRKLGLSQSSSRRSSASAFALFKSGSRGVHFRIVPPASF